MNRGGERGRGGMRERERERAQARRYISYARGEVRRRSGGELSSTAKAVQGVVLSLYFAFVCFLLLFCTRRKHRVFLSERFPSALPPLSKGFLFLFGRIISTSVFGHREKDIFQNVRRRPKIRTTRQSHIREVKCKNKNNTQIVSNHKCNLNDNSL